MSTLVERLRKIASAIYITVEKPVADDIADAVRKAADEIDALSARLTPPAEVVRYTMRPTLFVGSPAYRADVARMGEWVRYEDHAAALAAANARIKSLDEAGVEFEDEADAYESTIADLQRDLAASEAKRKDAEAQLARVTDPAYLTEKLAQLGITDAALDQPKAEDAA